MEGKSGLRYAGKVNRVFAMDSQGAQKEIDSILKTLDEAKQQSGLVSDDPSVKALEEIMLAKVAALEEGKVTAVQVPDATTPNRAK